MCGIVGALDFGGAGFRITEPYLVSMRDSMEHRGPDGCGTWIGEDGRVGLGHRRLSIIDLSPDAAQPMATADGELWISLNGEIYNHAEVRAELERIGSHRWRTSHSDTEVILHAFREWGIDCVHRFRGMFAFALWDARRKELWLVRDRIGVKPLYYSVHHGRIVFASEIKALLQDPQTLFAGIRKLAGGTWLRVSADGWTNERCRRRSGLGSLGQGGTCLVSAEPCPVIPALVRVPRMSAWLRRRPAAGWSGKRTPMRDDRSATPLRVAHLSTDPGKRAGCPSAGIRGEPSGVHGSV